MNLWDKLTCKDGPDWLDRSEGQDWTGPEEGGGGGLTVAGDGSVAPPLALEVPRAVVIGGFHQLHWCCRGCGVYVSIQ